MRRYKYSRKGLIALFVFLIALICTDIPVHAVTHAARYAWRDDTGNIIFQVEDKLKTSTLHYKTLGVTIARCDLGTMHRSDDHEYITFPFNSRDVSSSVEQLDNGMIRTQFTIKESVLLSRVATYYPDWLTEIQSGDVCYLVLDSVMVCCDSNHAYGFLYDDGSRTGLIIENTYWNIPDMKCTECGGIVPPLKDGWYGAPGDGTPICYGHPNVKDGEDAPFL